MEALIAAFSSGITALIGLFVWWVKDQSKNRQALASLKASKITIGQRLINHRHVQKQLTEIRQKFQAHAVLLSKFHNGEYYSDGQHIDKWSVILQDGHPALAEQLQNRLTRNSILFFGDLKDDGIMHCSDINTLPCVGMKSVLKSLGAKAMIAAMAEESFVMVIFREERAVSSEDSHWLLQELSSFVQYV